MEALDVSSGNAGGDFFPTEETTLRHAVLFSAPTICRLSFASLFCVVVRL